MKQEERDEGMMTFAAIAKAENTTRDEVYKNYYSAIKKIQNSEYAKEIMKAFNQHGVEKR